MKPPVERIEDIPPVQKGKRMIPCQRGTFRCVINSTSLFCIPAHKKMAGRQKKGAYIDYIERNMLLQGQPVASGKHSLYAPQSYGNEQANIPFIPFCEMSRGMSWSRSTGGFIANIPFIPFDYTAMSKGIFHPNIPSFPLPV